MSEDGVAGFDWTIHRHEELDSTNLEALRMARQGAGPGTVVVARTQTAGRGRLGRNWTDLPGRCLLLSALLEPPAGAEGLLTAAMALAATEAIDCLGKVAPRIKWPNDVVLAGRKVAGVLAEGSSDGPVAVGLGINVNGSSADLPEGLRDRACFVSEHLGREVDLRELEGTVLSHVSEAYGRLARGKSADLVKALNRYDDLAGREIEAAVGGETIRGTARGWLPDGRLMIEGEDGREIRLDAGEVTLS